jgi:hypothetical protein
MGQSDVLLEAFKRVYESLHRVRMVGSGMSYDSAEEPSILFAIGAKNASI